MGAFSVQNSAFSSRIPHSQPRQNFATSLSVPSKRKSSSAADQKAEEKEVQERAAPAGKIVYKAILHEGRNELERSTSALFFSGCAAGLSMGFSFLTQALLQARLPDTAWRPLISDLGYSTGFLIVVLGRQQLFTENTLTPILPLLLDRRKKVLLNVLRLWVVVFIANLLGTFLFAWSLTSQSLFNPDIQYAMHQIGHEALKNSFAVVMFKGVFAGWLIAMMVWLLPFAETGRIWVIILLTYMISIGKFSHIIAGSVDAFYIALIGEKSWITVVFNFILPTLIGNLIGGVVLVAVLNHAQVVAGEQGDDL